MSIWQRGTSFSLSAGQTYTADRWITVISGAGSTSTISQQATTAAELSALEIQNPQFYLRYAVTVAGSVTYRDLAQRIEDVRTFAGQNVTVSFYAKAASSITVGVQMYQGFGSGGSADTSTTPINVTIGTSWQKYTVTIACPSISGKTIGSGSMVATVFILPNSTFTLDITMVQSEYGSTATSFDYRPYGTELQLCQRYYEKSFEQATAPANGASGTTFASNLGLFGVVSTNRTSFGGTQIVFKVPKRTTPIITKFGNSSGFWGYLAANGTALTWSASIDPQAVSENGFIISQQVVDGTFVMVNGHWTASAEL
jgi:hypothetical protein